MSFFEPIIPRLPQLASNIAPQLLPTIYSGSTHSLKPNQLYQNDYDHSNFNRQNQVSNNAPINNAPVNNPAINNPNFLAANVSNNDNKQEQTHNNHYYNPGKPTNGINYFPSIPDNTKLLNQVLPFALNNNSEGGNNTSNFGYYSPLLDYQNQNIHMPINNSNVPFYSPLPDYLSQKTLNNNASFSSNNNIPKVSHPIHHQQLPTTPLNPQKNTVLSSIDSILKRESQYTSIPYRNNFDYLTPSLIDSNYTKNGNNNNTNIPQTIISSSVGEVIEDIVKARAQDKPFPGAIGSEIKQKKMSKTSSSEVKKENVDKNKKYFDEFNSLININNENEKPIQQNMIASAFSKSMIDSKNITNIISYNIINDNGALHQKTHNSNIIAANLLDNFNGIKENNKNGMLEAKENDILSPNSMRKLTKSSKVKKGKNDKKMDTTLQSNKKGKKKNFYNRTMETKKTNEVVESSPIVGKENVSPKNKSAVKSRINNVKPGVTI